MPISFAVVTSLNLSLGNSLQHGPGLQDEGWERDAAQVGAWPKLGDDV
jgi:hypothetical protein